MSRPTDISEEIWERADILRDQFQDVKDDAEFVARILMAVGQGPQVGVTGAQAKIVNFIRGYQAEHDGASPSQAEIGAHMGRSKGNVNGYLRRLQERGVVSMTPNRARSITIVARA